MTWPLAETLAIIKPHLPRSLISDHAFSSVKMLADKLPEMTSSYYWECRLAANAPQVDFLACLAASDGGREILAGRGKREDMPWFFAGDPVWRRVKDFCSRWADPASSLYEQVSHIWLEFDFSAPPSRVPPPGLLFCLDPEYFERGRQPRHVNYLTAPAYQQVIDTALEALLDYPVSHQTRENLLSCFDQLPTGGYIIHASVMLSRQPPQVKLNISVPKDRLLDYLQGVRWTGLLFDVSTILSKYGASRDRIKFQLTIGDTVPPKIDFEFHFESSLQNDPGLRLLLDQVVTDGCCTPEKRDALLTWPGTFRQPFSHHSWPTRFYKWADIKVVYQPDRSLEAKGYLGFMPSSSIF
jgi:hypothetical protein